MRRTTSLSMGIPKAKVICCAIRGYPQLGFRCFMSTSPLSFDAVVLAVIARQCHAFEWMHLNSGRR